MKISIIIPVFNDAESLLELNERLLGVMLTRETPFELIYVNDGSTDHSSEILTGLLETNDCIKVIELDANYGQNAAYIAGLDHASGEILLSIDADLQLFPEDIPLLLDEIEKGSDFVSGIRSKRKDSLFLRRIPSLLGNRVIRIATGINLSDIGCGLNAVRRRIVEEAINPVRGSHRQESAVFSNGVKKGCGKKYLKPAILKQAERVSEVEVRHAERAYGRSQYNFLDLAGLFIELLFSFSKTTLPGKQDTQIYKVKKIYPFPSHERPG